MTITPAVTTVSLLVLGFRPSFCALAAISLSLLTFLPPLEYRSLLVAVTMPQRCGIGRLGIICISESVKNPHIMCSGSVDETALWTGPKLEAQNEPSAMSSAAQTDTLITQNHLIGTHITYDAHSKLCHCQRSSSEIGNRISVPSTTHSK
jgi:hypothetical protein